MSFSERLTQWKDQLRDQVKDQEWYQQLEASYDQLGPEQQDYVKWGGMGALAILFFYLLFSTLSSSNGVKSEYFQKQELLQEVNQAGDEIKRLKGQNAGFTQSTPGQNWKAALEGIASAQGLPVEAVELTKESPGASQNIIQETLLEVQIKNVSVRTLMQFLYAAEHGAPPIKMKGLQVDTAGDSVLTAKLNLSGYMPKPEKK